jgi:hypothetical protein
MPSLDDKARYILFKEYSDRRTDYEIYEGCNKSQVSPKQAIGFQPRPWKIQSHQKSGSI